MEKNFTLQRGFSSSVVIATIISVVAGYCPYWIPYYAKLFTADIHVVGSLPKYAHPCEIAPEENSICTDEWRIPVDVARQFGQDMAIGFGSILYTSQFGCYDHNQFSTKFTFGNTKDYSLGHHLYRTYNTYPVSAFNCDEFIAIRAWSGKKMVRHGYDGGLIVLGTLERLDQMKRLIEICSIYFHQIAVLFALLALIILSPFLKTVSTNQIREPFFESIPLWVAAALFTGSGVVRTLVPALTPGDTQLRIGLYLSLMCHTILFIKIIDVKSTSVLKLTTPFVSPFKSYPTLNTIFSPLSIIFISLCMLPHYSACFMVVQLGIAILGALLSLRNRNVLAAFFVIHIAALLRMMNVSYTPQSNAAYTFYGIYCVLASMKVFDLEIRSTLQSLAEALGKDRSMAEKLAHDFRSPIGALKMLTSQLSWTSENEEIRAAVKNTLDQMSLLSRSMQKDIGDFTISSKEVILQSMKTYRAAFPQIEQTIRIEAESFSVAMSKPVFSRVIDNLVKNAYEAKNVTLVSIKCTVATENLLKVEISNNGNPIPADIIDLVIKGGFSFGKTEGSGIGIAYCKSEIGRVGGLFFLESDNTSTRVCIKIPGHARGVTR